MKVKYLPILKDDKTEFEKVEEEIKRVFREQVYYPILKTLGIPKKKLKNAVDSALTSAIQSGRIVFKRGRFSGEFNSQITKELRGIGAKWDPKSQSYALPFSKLPSDVRLSVRLSEQKFLEKISTVDQYLLSVSPEAVAKAVKVEKFFDKAIFKVDTAVADSVKSISIIPKLSTEARKTLASKWSNNMDLWIRDFTEKETRELRRTVEQKVLQGARYDDIAKIIEESYGVTSRKAKFLASQETRLMVTNLKESRYTEAGVTEYRWRCVVGSPNHPVRPSHKILDGKIFSWNDPPITTAPSEPVRRNNPGQDYNCRCNAQPVYRPKKE